MSIVRSYNTCLPIQSIPSHRTPPRTGWREQASSTFLGPIIAEMMIYFHLQLKCKCFLTFEGPSPGRHENQCRSPWHKKEDCQAPYLLKALALEMIDDQNNCSKWTHISTDESSGMLKNSGRLTPRTFSTAKISSNFTAESLAELLAAKTLEVDLPTSRDRLLHQL